MPRWKTKSREARGYGAPHRRRRRILEAIVATGQVPCARCGWPILPGEAWDLDHTDDRRGYLGPSHRFKKDCPAGGNRSSGARRQQQQQRYRASRVW